MAPLWKRTSNLIDSASFRYAKPPTHVTDVSTAVHEGEKMVVALIESRNRDIGVCYANRDYPTLITIVQYVDHPTYMHSITLLMRLDPDAVIVSKNALGTTFLDEIGIRFASKIVTVDRKHFDETFGKEKIDRCMTKPTTSLDPYFCACSAFAAVWRYFEWTIDCTLRQDYTEVVLERPENQLLLDPNALTSLEILSTSKSTDATPLQAAHALSSLFRPCSATGVRRLRQALQAPNSCVASLRKRLGSVERMVEEPVPLEALREELSKLGDMELTIKKATAIPRAPKIQAWAYSTIEAFFLVRTILQAAPRIKEHVGLLMKDDADLINIHGILNDDNISGMDEVIKRMVNLDYKPRNKSERQNIFYAIRPGIDKVLDVARDVWTQTLGKVYQLHREYVAEYPKLQIKLEAREKHGYVLSHKAPPDDEAKLNREFIMVPGASCRKDVFYSTTPRLTDLNSKFKAAEKELYARIMLCLEKTSDFLRARQKYLHTLVHTLTTLDFLSTLAHFSIQVHGVKPDFVENSPLIIVGAKHPIKSFFVPYIGCDFFFLGQSTDNEKASNLRIVTGYNGGGKTSRLQTLGLICVLAHVGCFVPCTICKLPPLKRIFTRMGTQDSIETNASTFLMEMKEAYEVFRDEADAQTLVLIDELGRGTSHSEGAAFCWAMCEKLREMNCMTLFATHFIELCNMRGAMIEYIATDGEQAYKSISLEPADAKAELDSQRYGIKKAKELSFPDEVIEKAHGFSKQINTIFFRPSVSIGDMKIHPDDVVKMGQNLRELFENDDDTVLDLLGSFYRSHFSGENQVQMKVPCPSPTLEVVFPEGVNTALVPNPECSPLVDLAPDCIDYVPFVSHPRDQLDVNREFYADSMDLLEQCTGTQSGRLMDRTSAVLAASPTLEDDYFSEAVFHSRVDNHTPDDDTHVRQVLRHELERHRNKGERHFVEEKALEGELGKRAGKRRTSMVKQAIAPATEPCLDNSASIGQTAEHNNLPIVSPEYSPSTPSSSSTTPAPVLATPQSAKRCAVDTGGVDLRARVPAEPADSKWEHVRVIPMDTFLGENPRTEHPEIERQAGSPRRSPAFRRNDHERIERDEIVEKDEPPQEQVTPAPPPATPGGDPRSARSSVYSALSGLLSPVNSQSSTISASAKRGPHAQWSAPPKRRKVYTTCAELYEDWIRHNQRMLGDEISERAFAEWEAKAWEHLDEVEREKWGPLAESKIAELNNDIPDTDFIAHDETQLDLCDDRQEQHGGKLQYRTPSRNKENNSCGNMA